MVTSYSGSEDIVCWSIIVICTDRHVLRDQLDSRSTFSRLMDRVLERAIFLMGMLCHLGGLLRVCLSEWHQPALHA